ncbi:MAG TPA: LPS export ABC transporter permease LptF [Burkholderiaceae bacterium]|nr:LPS export ABC transporter permease LptF [Burkholderiaceae bacterium]
MLFEKALRRELFASASGVFVTLLTILIAVSLIRILGQAAAGRVGVESVVLLIGLAAVNYLPVVLVVTLFISVLLVISRMYRDSEMVIWFSSGVALTSFVRPVLRLAMPVALVVFGFAMVVSPWANLEISQLRARFEQRDDVSKVAPGQFIESSSSERVFFVENLDDQKRVVDNVFATMRQKNGDTAVLVARTGRIEERANGERFVVLEDGRRYEGKPGNAEFTITEFTRYSVRLEPRRIVLDPAGANGRTLTAMQVLEDTSPPARGELAWRLSLPLFAINLALLAIPLAFVNPRAGRAAGLIFAILAYVVYSNLVQASRTWIESSKISFGMGWWIVHAVVFGLVMLMLWQRRSAVRLNPFSPRTWRAWRFKRGDAA